MRVSLGSRWGCRAGVVPRQNPSHDSTPPLVESRIPFEMVHDRLLDASHLAGLRTLILPNVEALSDARCRPRSATNAAPSGATSPSRSASAKRVALLVGGGSPPFRQAGAWLETAVPTILAHEVVAIDL